MLNNHWGVYVCGPDSLEESPILYATFNEHPKDADDYAKELATRYSKECHIFVINHEGLLTYSKRGNHVCNKSCIHNQGRR